MQKIFDKILSIKNKYKSSIVFDTRNLKKNDIFIGIKTQKNDGSLFYKHALRKNAGLILINNPSAYHQNICQINNINNFILNFCKFLLSQYKGKIIAIVSEGDKEVKEIADHIIKVPDSIESMTPFMTVIPLQLLSYHIAVMLGKDVDQPRNLAKSVTVE